MSHQQAASPAEGGRAAASLGGLDSKSFSLMQSAQALLAGGPRGGVSSAAHLSFGSFSPVASPTPSGGGPHSTASRQQVRREQKLL